MTILISTVIAKLYVIMGAAIWQMVAITFNFHFEFSHYFPSVCRCTVLIFDVSFRTFTHWGILKTLWFTKHYYKKTRGIVLMLSCVGTGLASVRLGIKMEKYYTWWYKKSRINRKCGGFPFWRWARDFEYFWRLGRKKRS